MKVTLNLSKDFIDILEKHGSSVNIPHKEYSILTEPKYYFLPYWFEKTEDEGVYELHMLDHLPPELLETLNFMRDKDKPLKQY